MTEKTTVKSYIDPDVLREDIKFSEADVDDAIIEQAALYADYGARAADAQHQVDKHKLLLDITIAREADAMRAEALENKEKIAEKTIESRLDTLPAVIRARKAHLDAKRQFELAKNALEAFKQRRDMLIQTGVRLREEAKGDVRVSGDADARARRQAKAAIPAE